MATLVGALVAKGKFDDAVRLGIEAVEAAPEDIQVRDMVAAALGRSVQSWHVPMLQDEPRNRCYRQALERAIRPGMRVLEIGTGAGFLSLVAARAGAEVFTCEVNPVVAAVARVVAERNGLADRIHVISKVSSALEIGIDLPERADLFMSELFDDTLFGDGLVEYIADAKRRLLIEGAPIVPARAELRCALVEIPAAGSHKPLGMVEGFDMTALNVAAPRLSGRMRARKAKAEPRSKPVSSLFLDFDNERFENVIRDEVALSSFGGTVNGLAQWIRFDFGGGIVFENDPFGGGATSHWGAPLTPFVEDRRTEPGEIVTVAVLRVGREVFYRPRAPQPGEAAADR